MKIGTLVASRYTLLRELGRGGMGAVFVARDERLGGEVALKIAYAGADAAPELRERFQREARIGNRLGKTAGFVRAFDFGETGEGGQLYLAMDLVRDARALDLTSGSLDERMSRLRDAARLVAEAHRQGVIHRDLKPANFLQEPGGRLWLTDFGLSKLKEDAVPELAERASGLTRSGIAAGTPAFMPPEQFDDVKRVDERCDVFALGVMLYVALTLGKVPYDGSFAAIAQRQARVGAGLEPPPSPGRLTRIPPELDRVCLATLELERSKRLASADLLVAALDGHLAPRAPILVTPSAPPTSDPTLPTVPPSAPEVRVRRVSSPPVPASVPRAAVQTPSNLPLAEPLPSSTPLGPSAALPPASRTRGCCIVGLVLAALAVIAGLGLLAVALVREEARREVVGPQAPGTSFQLELRSFAGPPGSHDATFERFRGSVERRAQRLAPGATAALNGETVMLRIPETTEATLDSLMEVLRPQGYVVFRCPGDGLKLAALDHPLFTSDEIADVKQVAPNGKPMFLLRVRADVIPRLAIDSSACCGGIVEAWTDGARIYSFRLDSPIPGGSLRVNGAALPDARRLLHVLELRDASYPEAVSVERLAR